MKRGIRRRICFRVTIFVIQREYYLSERHSLQNVVIKSGLEAHIYVYIILYILHENASHKCHILQNDIDY